MNSNTNGAVVSRTEFLSHFESVKQTVIGEHVYSSDPRLKSLFERAEQLLDYTVPNGKLNRGITVVETYIFLEESRGGLCAHKKEAFMLGWAVELMQAFFLIADDIMDHSETRRGKPCWYKLESVSLDAINDTFFMEQLVYKLIKSHCQSLPSYHSILELFHDTIYRTTLGQTLDLTTAPVGKPNLDNFTEEKYLTIAAYKTAYYTIYMPIVCALMLSEGAQAPADEVLKQVEAISISLGTFFQIQDDYLDLYGDPKVTGKIGTDIADNKCSWLVVQALKHCSGEQRQVLKQNYGYSDPAKVRCVENVFHEIGVQSLYQEYEKRSYDELVSTIAQLQNSALRKTFESLCAKLFKRNR